jgi:hypothetical protein
VAADEKERKPLQSREEVKQRREQADYSPPPRPTRFIFKLLGLILVLFAGWLAWFSYRQGGLPDLTDPNQQDRAMRQLTADAEKAKEKSLAFSEKAINWAQASLGDLEKVIKGNPPKTPEESKALVDESKHNIEKAPPPPPPPTAPVIKAPDPLAGPQEEYRIGQQFYAKTDPMASQKQVQDNLRLAEPHFSKCLDMLNSAHGKGASEAEIDRLAQAAARRLYDCRKRMELRP